MPTKALLRFCLTSFLIAMTTAAAYGTDIGLSPASRAVLHKFLFGQTTWDLVRDCNAVQGGNVDATSAFQYCVNAAQAIGGRVHIPAGSGLKIGGQVKVTSHIFIEGDGAQGDQVNSTGTSGFTASALIATNLSTAIIAITSDESVILADFQISYPTQPTFNVPCITLDAGTNGALHINPYSHFRNLHIMRAGTGIQTVNAETYVFDNLKIEGSSGSALALQDVNFPGSGDSTVTNSTFSGSSAGGAIAITSGGGIRLVNNKINMPGLSTCTGSNLCIGILIAGTVSTSQGISPVIIVGNSIEGTDDGILFQQTSTEKIGNVVITGNEIVSQISVIGVQAHGSNYLTGLTITGNHFFIGSSSTFISLLNVNNGVIMGNTFIAAAASTAISGSGNTLIFGSSATNSYGSGVT
jgi:hypothetical protein